jgi:chorismate-pyruvate lyase
MSPMSSLNFNRLHASLVCATLAVAGPAAAKESAQASWPDTFESRLKLLAIIETLNADLLTTHSATVTLSQWCADHHLAAKPQIFAHLHHGIDKPISSEQRQALEIGPNEPVVYRRVDLVCGRHVLSQADNWYVPSRLTPAMNKALRTTDIPFGKVVRPLHISRTTLAAKLLWHPLPPGWDMHEAAPGHPQQLLSVPRYLIRHRAIVFAGNGKPIAEVDETYRSDMLDFRPE